MKLYGRYSKTPWILSEHETINGLISGDWHITDKYAPLPNQACTKEGQTVLASPLQAKIKEELIKELKQIGKVHVLIIPGDILEGIQTKDHGIPVSDSDSDTQVNWAFQFYEETYYKYNNPDVVVIVMGTPYHVMTGIGGNLDYQVACKIDQITPVVFGYPNIQFKLGKTGLLWDVRHRVSIASVNRLMPIEKTFRMFYRECAEMGLTVPDVVGRAHNHSIALAPTNLSMGKIKRYGWHSPTLKASDVYGEGMSYPSSPKLGFLSFTQGEELFGRYHALDIENVEEEKI